MVLALSLLLLGCGPREDDGVTVRGMLGGAVFDPDTVVFQELGAGPYDTAAPEHRQFVMALADAEDACPLMGPLYHYGYLRCESACTGFFEQQELWPSSELRVLWLVVTVDEQLEASYGLATSDDPGAFTANYRPVDFGLLQGHDATSCYEACTADYGFLLTDQARANTGELELTGYDDEVLSGSFDLLFSEGEVEALFDAPVCEMGAH